MCCGQKRLELRNRQAQGTAPTVPQRVSGNSQPQAVRTQPSTQLGMRTVSPLPPGSSVQPQASVPISMLRASISLCYLENSPIRVRGLVSGLCYEFSGSRAVQHVDARDAPSLLSTRFFRRA